MQRAGDTTEESAGRASRGIVRWFPRGYYTEGVDWAALEEHLSMVPDLAFEVTSSARIINSRANHSATTSQESMPIGVCALHLVVACDNPAAPLSFVQMLIDANPDALHQTEEKSGWNVLHCALRHNRHLSIDHGIVDLLMQANPELATEVSSTSVEEYGLPPLAYANCKEVVPVLVNAMPTKLVTSILKKIFARRKLLGGSIEAMEQIVRDVSILELRQGRSILAAGILPDNIARKQSLVEYGLHRTSLRSRTSSERRDLLRLVDLIIQATYCLSFHKDGDETALNTCPPPLQCLKTLGKEQKIKQKPLQLYQSIQKGGNQYLENVDFVEPDHNDGSDQNIDHGTLWTEGEPTGQVKQIELEELESKPVVASPYVKKLLKCKDELDTKIHESYSVLKEAAAALEGYARFSKTLDILCEEAQATTSRDAPSSSSKASSSTPLDDSTQATLAAHTEENMASIRAVVAMSSTPPTPRARQQSDDAATNQRDLHRLMLEESIQEAVENMKEASLALDRYNLKVSIESGTLVREQEDQKEMDLGYFRTAEHNQAKRAMADIAELQIEQESLVKCINDMKSQLKEAESLKDQTAQSARCLELNLNWAKLTGELRDVTRNIEELREIVTNRRKNVGARMIKVRRTLNSKTCSRASRTHASRFLREAKKEMREFMATLLATSAEKTTAQKKSCRRHRKKKLKQQRQKGAEDELTRMTKRMKL